MFQILAFVKLCRSQDWPTPSPSYPSRPTQPQWPSPSQEWPSVEFPIPEWPSPSEKWPDPPYYPPDTHNGLTTFQIVMIVVGSISVVAIIVIVSIILWRRRQQNLAKAPKYVNPNMSAPTDSLLQNTDEL